MEVAVDHGELRGDGRGSRLERLAHAFLLGVGWFVPYYGHARQHREIPPTPP